MSLRNEWLNQEQRLLTIRKTLVKFVASRRSEISASKSDLPPYPGTFNSYSLAHQKPPHFRKQIVKFTLNITSIKDQLIFVKVKALEIKRRISFNHVVDVPMSVACYHALMKSGFVLGICCAIGCHTSMAIWNAIGNGRGCTYDMVFCGGTKNFMSVHAYIHKCKTVF